MFLIVDTSPLISLIVINKLNLLKELFPEFNLPNAVWEELEAHNQLKLYKKELDFLKQYVNKSISSPITIPGIDKGETEAIQLYIELNANVLLIDDKKARSIAELMDIKCIGTIALLTLAKRKKLIAAIRPLFISLLSNKRYYSKKLLDQVLVLNNEKKLD